MVTFRICAGITLLLCMLPVLSMLLSVMISNRLGCELDEGNIHPCLWHGRDIGGTLYNMFTIAWLGVVTVPFALILAVSWATIEVLR